jgi:hypothetical protein
MKVAGYKLSAIQLQRLKRTCFVTFRREPLRKEEMRTNLPKPESTNKASVKHAPGATLTSPSSRVPVTFANRDYLRFLRQAELDAWRRAPGGTVCRNQ